MGKPTKFDGMMYDFCVNFGYCGSAINGKATHVTDFIPEEGLVSADQFVTWLIKADQCDPSDIDLRKQFIQIFN